MYVVAIGSIHLITEICSFANSSKFFITCDFLICSKINNTMKRRCPSRRFKPKKRARIEKPFKLEETTITPASESAPEPITDPAPDWSLMVPEVLLRIFSKLDYDSLRKCATACRFWLQCANDESLAVVLIDTIPFVRYMDDEANWEDKAIQANYKSLRSDGDYDNKTVCLRHKNVSDYITQDYIELREDTADRLSIYLRTARLPEKIHQEVTKVLRARLDENVLIAINKSIIRTYKENFNPMDPRSFKLEPYLPLNDDQQQAVLWMMQRETNETTFNIRPMVPLKHTPLALHIPSGEFRMKKDIPEVTLAASNGLIVADKFYTAAGEVIGLIYATLSNAQKKCLKTLIVVKDMARATRWADYLFEVPNLYFAINPPPYIPYLNDPRVTVWIYTLRAYTRAWHSKPPPLARVIFDEDCAGCNTVGRFKTFEWYLKILDESTNVMNARHLTKWIKLEKDNFGVVERIKFPHEEAMKYFREWTLVSQLMQHCVWICRGRELSIILNNEREYYEYDVIEHDDIDV